ncbi:Gfo/Idh/MocA family protein [Aminobacter sp. HY435]|uniref:Gfo/Idh/MocA family protein n=1 Tax=Aminobacter sp. HY435 TaxID=2970917 RepID=UPI0022B984B1|nr:Gfo/Idh/MocA family oxidoreductase [Aminobacter sp. HY435]
MTDKPHVGLIGCGGWGKLILRDLKTLGARVTCVAPSERSRANAMANGADHIVSTMAELPAVEGAVVATPSDNHGAVLLGLLPRNIPLFVEKPLTSDLATAQLLARTAPDRIFVMDKWRYHSGIERIAQYARSGEIGDVLGLRLYRLGWSMTHNEVDPIWNLLPHDLSICLHVLGNIPPVDVAFADGLGPASSGLVALLGRTAGPRVVIETSAHHPVNRRSVILACTSGTVTLNGSLDDHLILRQGTPDKLDAPEIKVPFQNDMPLKAELAVFLRHLRGGPPPMSSVAEGALIVERVCEIRRKAGLPE